MASLSEKFVGVIGFPRQYRVSSRAAKSPPRIRSIAGWDTTCNPTSLDSDVLSVPLIPTMCARGEHCERSSIDDVTSSRRAERAGGSPCAYTFLSRIAYTGWSMMLARACPLRGGNIRLELAPEGVNSEEIHPVLRRADPRAIAYFRYPILSCVVGLRGPKPIATQMVKTPGLASLDARRMSAGRNSRCQSAIASLAQSTATRGKRR